MYFPSVKQQLLEAARSADVGKYIELTELHSSCYQLSKIVNKNGDTVVHLAARSGCVDIIKHCNEALLTQRNNDGKTPLHIAAHSGQAACVRYLLSCGVPVDALKRSDWTPLMLSCTKSDLNVVRILLEYGANPTLQNKDGWTALHIASREGNVDIIKCLLNLDSSLWKTQSKNGRTPLHTSALHGKIETVKLFLNETNHDKDPVDSCGTTPVMDAVSGNHNEIVKLLIDAGASLTKTDCLGRNLLHFAAQANNADCLRYLIQNCYIDVNSRTTDGLTTLHFASKESSLCCVKILLQSGADCLLQDNKGRTALDYSCNEEISTILRNISVTE